MVSAFPLRPLTPALSPEYWGEGVNQESSSPFSSPVSEIRRMKSFFVKCVVALGVLSFAFLSLTASAQNEKKDKKKNTDPTAAISKKLEAVELTAEQKTKIDAIK